MRLRAAELCGLRVRRDGDDCLPFADAYSHDNSGTGDHYGRADHARPDHAAPQHDSRPMLGRMRVGMERWHVEQVER